MSVEEEIARALAEWRSGERAEPWEVDMYSDAAAALTPLLNRVRAEALRDAATEIDRYVGTVLNPAGAASMVRARAQRIEQNSEGNET